MVRFHTLSTVDLETPLLETTTDESLSESGSPMSWLQLVSGLILLLGGLAIFASSTLTWCDESVECYNMVEQASSKYHIFGVCIIAPLLLAELINLAISSNKSHEAPVGVTSLPSRWRVSFLMCLVFSILFCTEATCAIAQPLVFAVPQDGPMEPWRPVYTTRYIEWSLNVPLLLIISGHFCLGRPMSELMGPIFLTDVYIFLSWEAFVVESVYLSRTLVAISFSLYAWASYEMWLWAARFLRMAPANFPAQRLRAAMIVGLVVIFGLYGVVNLLAMSGTIGAAAEMICYSIGDVGVKTSFCIGLTAIRSLDSRHALAASLQHITRQSNVLMSLLRGSFDIVMACTLDSNGNCWLPSAESPDSRKLEHWLNRPVAGCALNQLLDGPDQQRRFHSYVLGAMQRKDINSVSSNGVAQVINCALSSTSGHGDASKMTAVLHLSGVASAAIEDMSIHWDMGRTEHRDMGRTAFIAMCISPGQEEVPFVETQRCISSDLRSAQALEDEVTSLGSLSISDPSNSRLSDGLSMLSSSKGPKSDSSHGTLKEQLERSSQASQGTSKKRRHASNKSLQQVPEQVPGNTSSAYSSWERKEFVDSSVQTEDKVDISVVACLEAVVPILSRPPMLPSHPLTLPETLARTRDGGDTAAAESLRTGADRVDTLCDEASQEERTRIWKARKDKRKDKKSKEKGIRRSSSKETYQSQLSSDSNCSGRSSRASYNSGTEEALLPLPAHVVSHRAPRGSGWYQTEGDANEKPRRAWISPTVELLSPAVEPQNTP